MVAEVPRPEVGSLRVLGQAVSVAGSDEGWLRAHPPLLGEHTAAILHELGYRSAQVREMLAEGVVACTSPP
jgi:crotonobetainyl-CoA:carnitine CoA-transferase CaiB-like acyl-CoA transferase